MGCATSRWIGYAGHVLCPSEEELPRRQLRIHDDLEDSLLEGLGRRLRPVHRIGAVCR